MKRGKVARAARSSPRRGGSGGNRGPGGVGVWSRALRERRILCALAADGTLPPLVPVQERGLSRWHPGQGTNDKEKGQRLPGVPVSGTELLLVGDGKGHGKGPLSQLSV